MEVIALPHVCFMTDTTSMQALGVALCKTGSGGSALTTWLGSAGSALTMWLGGGGSVLTICLGSGGSVLTTWLGSGGSAMTDLMTICRSALFRQKLFFYSSLNSKLGGICASLVSLPRETCVLVFCKLSSHYSQSSSSLGFIPPTWPKLFRDVIFSVTRA